MPGPGNYYSNLSDKPSAARFGFGTSTRNAKKDNTKSPGPGNYVYRTFVGTEGKKNSIHAKLEVGGTFEKTKGGSPGPGNYESSLKHLKSEPRYGMGSG